MTSDERHDLIAAMREELKANPNDRFVRQQLADVLEEDGDTQRAMVMRELVGLGLLERTAYAHPGFREELLSDCQYHYSLGGDEADFNPPGLHIAIEWDEDVCVWYAQVRWEMDFDYPYVHLQDGSTIDLNMLRKRAGIG